MRAPKPGLLYPNLSDIERSTESENESEYTVDSEPVTATLDEKSETEETTDYDVQVREIIHERVCVFIY